MATKAKAGDVTGRLREEQAAAFAEEQQTRATEMAMASATAQIKLETETFDATRPEMPMVIVDEAIKVGKQNSTVEIRVLETIENMTLGAGNNYNFKAGSKYLVTTELANHLFEKNLAQRV